MSASHRRVSSFKPMHWLPGIVGGKLLISAPQMHLANWLDPMTFTPMVLDQLQPPFLLEDTESDAVIAVVSRGRIDLDTALLLMFKRDHSNIKVPGLRGISKDGRVALDCFVDYLASVQAICHSLHPKIPVEQMPYGNSLHWFAAFIAMLNGEILRRAKCVDNRSRRESSDDLLKIIAELRDIENPKNLMPRAIKALHYPRWLILEWGVYFACTDHDWQKRYWSGRQGFLTAWSKYARAQSGSGCARIVVEGQRAYQICGSGARRHLVEIVLEAPALAVLPPLEKLPML